MKGEANMLLYVLETRGIPVPDHIRDQINSCDDLDQLHRWAKCAMTSDTAEEFSANFSNADAM